MKRFLTSITVALLAVQRRAEEVVEAVARVNQLEAERDEAIARLNTDRRAAVEIVDRAEKRLSIVRQELVETTEKLAKQCDRTAQAEKAGRDEIARLKGELAEQTAKAATVNELRNQLADSDVALARMTTTAAERFETITRLERELTHYRQPSPPPVANPDLPFKLDVAPPGEWRPRDR